MVKISQSDIADSGVTPIHDYIADKRNDNGYVKISLNLESAMMVNQSLTQSIKQKQEELSKLKQQQASIEDIEDRRREELRNMSKEEKKWIKKRKKDEKKQKKKLKNMPESAKILHSAINEYRDKYFKENEPADGITVKHKRKRDTTPKPSKELTDEEKAELERKQETHEFNKKFEEPLMLMRDIILQADDTIAKVNAMIDETWKGSSKYKSSTLKDLLSTKTGLLSAKTSNAKNIGDIQKMRIELELKKIKEKGSDETNEKTKGISVINQAFPHLISGITGLSKKNKDEKKKDKDDNDTIDWKKDKKKKDWKKSVYNQDFEDGFNKKAASLIRDGKLSLTPYETYIGMEGRWKPAIQKLYDGSDWQFVALDNSGTIIDDFKEKYPGLLPKKKHVNMVFDDDNELAKDKNNPKVLYPVIYTRRTSLKK